MTHVPAIVTERRTTRDDAQTSRLYRGLLYGQQWEDTAADRLLLRPGPGDRCLAVTSAGCSVLDLLLCDVAAVLAVDCNPVQTAVLELKLAVIRHLDYPDFWALFGDGQGTATAYERVRGHLPDAVRRFWDAHAQKLTRGVHQLGRSSWVLRWLRWVVWRCCGPKAMTALRSARTLHEQVWWFEERFRPRVFNPLFVRGLSSWPSRFALGIHPQQNRRLRANSPQDYGRLLEERLTQVFHQILIWENPYWQQILFGQYFAPETAPAYLRPAAFPVLQARVDRVTAVTGALSRVLGRLPGGSLDKFNLLDCPDTLDNQANDLLWQELGHVASPRAAVLARSLGSDLPLPALAQAAGWSPREFPPGVVERTGLYGGLHCFTKEPSAC